MKLKAFVLAVLCVLMMALPITPGGLPAASAQSSLDDQRVADLSEIVSAFEAYGLVHGTYKISGAGYEKRGYGSFNVGGTESFPFSLADGLVAAGLLDVDDVPSEPSSGAGYATYLCLDRVGVFSIDDDLTTNVDDLAWWNANCPSSPFSSWDRTYMHLSDSFSYQGPASTAPVSDVVAALSAYTDDAGTFVVEHAGNRGEGWGWYSRDYSSFLYESLQQALVIGGYLDNANLPEGPGSLTRYWNGMYVSWCGGRFAVFAQPSAAGVAAPSAADAAFWSDNDCATWMFASRYGLTYFELGEKLDYDQVRFEAAGEIIAAMEASAFANHTGLLDDMGYNDEGRGWYSFENGTSYDLSIANGLAAAGYLDAFDMPAEDPWIAFDYDKGYISYHCKDRRAVFTRSSGTIAPTQDDADWWGLNDCRVPSSTAHTYFVLTEPLPLDQIRQQAVSRIVGALEDYGRSEFTYVVSGTGYRDDGYGGFNADRGLYEISIANGLIRDGYLDAELVIREPLSRDGFDSNGIRVYQCKDRVGAFSLTEAMTPTADDTVWWADNNCPTAALSNGRSYFELSDPLPLDQARETAVLAVIDAFERYAQDEGTFLIEGSGYQGNSGGWFTRTTADYDPNVATALAQAGYLNPDAIPEDPRRDDTYTNGLRVEHCNDRVAVFALSNGAEPSADDATWWADNDCTRNSIDNTNHTYYIVSQPASDLLTPLTSDELRQLAIAQTVSALESYGTQNATYTLPAGEGGLGQGWYQQGDTTNDSILDVLVAEGHITGTPLTDPLYNDTDGTGFDFQIYPCGNRVAVFSQTDTLVTYSDDAAWWADNNCDTTPLSTHGYFQLASELDTLDEPYVVVYSASVLPGYKTATVRLQPQTGAIGFAYAVATVVDSAGAAVPYVADSANASTIGCMDGGFCGLDEAGKMHAVTINAAGWPNPIDFLKRDIPEDQEIIVDVAIATVEDLANPAYDFAEFEFLLQINDYQIGPDFDEFNGLSNAGLINLDRCERDLYSFWNYTNFDLGLPTEFEMQIRGEGLVWTWDEVENSRDCYKWTAWAQNKDSERISGSTINAFDSGRAANIPEVQFDSETASFCIAVAPRTWVDQQARTNYISPTNALHSGNGPGWAEQCLTPTATATATSSATSTGPSATCSDSPNLAHRTSLPTSTGTTWSMQTTQSSCSHAPNESPSVTPTSRIANA